MVLRTIARARANAAVPLCAMIATKIIRAEAVLLNPRAVPSTWVNQYGPERLNQPNLRAILNYYLPML